MKNYIVTFLSIVFFYVAWQFYEKYRAEQEEFEVREHIVRNATECLESGNWECAEKSVRALLCDAPHDSNLQLHLAGILYEQERYEECIRYIDSVGVKTPDFEFLRKKSEQLIREMEELGIERSMHFRVEFEGHPSKSDVMEALAVLEVAYDSLCRLFDFRPKNKMSLVLYRSSEYQGMGPRPEWVGAIFDGKLRIPVGMMQYRELYRPVLFHELTHAFIRAMTRSHVPFWVNEGIAQVVDASRTALPRPEGAVPTLDALTAPFVKESRSDNAERLYWYSQRMVERLLARNASFVYFRDFIQSMHKMGDEEALQKFYGVTAAQLLDEVR
ncbi:hypothetical protein SAMN05720761_11236 [Fibrobacter sp. UWCM]|uniref:hypothetical protein n=1 Tax=Fibrobacter sp. UWCM TaxID=1896208 RepID=UPI0009150BA1|nr:hypothetical protein [Fibrobacter sp. UWCM]SHH30468.1 hypothetical protein SAMN05720761_11236 [Fibrobacter sp. UWCM]